MELREKKILRTSALPLFAMIASNGKWQLKPHLILIANEIYKTLKSKEIEILIVNMPPRHGKSELMSKYFPAWYLLNNPSKRIIFTTYSDRFAEQFGRTAQDMFIKYMTVFNTNIYSRKQSAGEWMTSEGGGMVSVGAGGSITGRGANILIIDDPIKNVSEALSKTNKENINDWLYTTAMTRLEPKGKIFLIHTRWQPDDITGKILETYEKQKYSYLSLKAISTEKEIFRNENEALWKERYDIKELNNIKEKITTYWFNAMYQQEPSSKGSEFININKFGHYQEDGENLIVTEKNMYIKKRDTKKYCCVDLAISEKQTADYTVFCIFKIDIFQNIYIEKIIRDRIPPDQHEETIERIIKDYSIDMIGIESVAYQETLIRRLGSKGLPITKLLPTKDKMVRLLSILPTLTEEKIFIKENSNWEKEFINELSQFPFGSHDDQVDAFSYMANFLGMNQKITIATKKSKINRDY